MKREHSHREPQDPSTGLQIKTVETPEARYRGWTAVDFRTWSGALWRVHKQAALVRPQTAPTSLEMKKITSALQKKTTGAINSRDEKNEENHLKAVNFLAINWDIISQGFYDEQFVRAFEPKVFMGVALGHLEKADLVGTGIDGRVFVIEAGEGRKSRRLRKVVQGIQALAPDLSPAGVFPLLVGLIDETKGANEQYRLQLYTQPIGI